MALRLRGRELVVPADAWAHFYPVPLAEARSDSGVPSRDEVERTRGWLHQKVLGSEGARSTSLLTCFTLFLPYCIVLTRLNLLDLLLTKVLGADIEWVRDLLRFGTGRATLRAFDEPASCLEDDKDGVTVEI